MKRTIMLAIGLLNISLNAADHNVCKKIARLQSEWDELEKKLASLNLKRQDLTRTYIGVGLGAGIPRNVVPNEHIELQIADAAEQRDQLPLEHDIHQDPQLGLERLRKSYKKLKKSEDGE